MSQDPNHLNHATWECKYHVVFTPKYRKKLLFGQIRRHLGTRSRQSIQWRWRSGKGKSSIWIAQNVERKLRDFLGHKFWARGYFVSTVGRDEETIRAYIKNQEIADKAVGSVATEARVLIKSHLLYQNPS